MRSAEHIQRFAAVSLENLGQHPDSPGVDLRHSLRHLIRKFLSAEVNVEQRGLETAVSGKRCDLADVPVATCEIGET
jgi:hypothetical protein